VNSAYVQSLEKAGLIFSGTSPFGDLCEIAELPKDEHPFFLGTQFHPELKARPLAPHPLFTAFIKASLKNKKL
jgi:CTP synthase